MEDDKKSVKPVKKGDSKKEGSEARLHLISSSLIESSEKIQRPRPMTVDEARWIANGKKMKVVQI
jgi:hypothetical protein